MILTWRSYCSNDICKVFYYLIFYLLVIIYLGAVCLISCKIPPRNIDLIHACYFLSMI